jgi:hypothetical protein
MATLVLRAPSAINSFLHKFAHEIGEFVEGIREAQAIAARYDALSRLSDVELARRGLTRADIPQAALTGRKPV